MEDFLPFPSNKFTRKSCSNSGYNRCATSRTEPKTMWFEKQVLAQLGRNNVSVSVCALLFVCAGKAIRMCVCVGEIASLNSGFSSIRR